MNKVELILMLASIVTLVCLTGLVSGTTCGRGSTYTAGRGGLVYLENARPSKAAGAGSLLGITSDLPVDGGQSLRPGTIYLANEARFTADYYSEPLTNYVVGWRDPNDIEATLDFLFPPVQTPRRFEFKKAENAEEFYSETDDVRSIGSDFKKVEFKGTSVNEKTLNKGLTIVVDLDEVREMANWQQVYTGRILRRLLRNELRRGITAASTAAVNVAKTWDGTAGKDPDLDVATELITATDASGIRPNRALYGEVSWNKRMIAHRAQTNAGGFGSSGLTPEEVAGLLGFSGGVRISRERYQSAAATKSKVLPDIVLMFYAENGVGPEDPTNTKRFWTPAEGGGKYRVYVQQLSAKLVAITVEHYSNLVVTSSLGMRKITVS